MTGLVAVDERCTACGVCVVTCPTSALRPAPLRPMVVAERCDGCLACVEVCPRDALREVTGPLRGERAGAS